MQKAHERYQEKDVVILAISIDGTGERAVNPLMIKHGYTFPALMDRSMDVARAFGVRLAPTTYVVNREGVIVGAGYGPLDLAGPVFDQYLQEVLSAW
ncbi:MAG: TlpA family protein disulfide reductase [Nitrospinae bacterium]|nr:TlpA family protein disulfide reductase [Nitrospinota bacterium]